MGTIIKTRALTKVYSGRPVVNKLDMNIEKGDIYGFIGRNGAGKTTTMKMLLGTIFPTGGEMELFGDKNLNAGRARNRVAYRRTRFI